MTVVNLAFGTTEAQVFHVNVALDEAKRTDPFWANHEFAVSFDAFTSVEGDSWEAFLLTDKILGVLSPQYA